MRDRAEITIPLVAPEDAGPPRIAEGDNANASRFALVFLCSIGTTECRHIAEAPDQTELHFMCLKHGQEEAAKHPVPDGKYVKVQCVHKSVPRIIE
jgi:hypothetical protein